MDILANVLDRVRLAGTVLFHYELGRPWSLALPAFPGAVFHYLSRGSATLALQQGRKLRLVEGDFAVVTRGEPHLIYSDRKTKPFPLLELAHLPTHQGVVRHGGNGRPISTLICGHFTLLRYSRSSVFELLPRILLLQPTSDHDRLETILQRMVTESALERPGQRAVLSRMTEVLFVEALRSWIKSLSPGEGGWLGAMSDPHIGRALQLIHEQPDRPWTLRDLARRVGLGRSAFSARFTKLVGQPVHSYLTARRMEEAAFLLESSDEGIAQIATGVGYATAAAFSKLFHRHQGLSPGRYRTARKFDDSGTQGDISGSQAADWRRVDQEKASRARPKGSKSNARRPKRKSMNSPGSEKGSLTRLG